MDPLGMLSPMPGEGHTGSLRLNINSKEARLILECHF